MSQTTRKLPAMTVSELGALPHKKHRHGQNLCCAQQQPSTDYRSLLSPETRASLDEFEAKKLGGATDGEHES